MTIALSLLLAAHRSQVSDLLDAAVAQPAEVITKQISTKGRFLADRYDFADEFKLDTLIKRKTPMSAMDSLIARGSEAIPYLTSQLSNQDPTKLKIGDNPDIASVGYEFYDPKLRQPDTEAWGVVTNDFIMKAPQYKHTITRGDLAFFALGQITNRWYGILGGNIVLNLYCSASDHLSIQKSAIDEWAKVTNEDLKQSIKNDVLHPDSYARQVFGFTRFRTYWPSEAPELAMDCLRNSYGRRPKNEPSAEPLSFILELQTVQSRTFDEEARILMRSDLDNGYLSDFDLTKYEVILYLRQRPDYLPIAINYATEQVKTKKDKYGLFKRFLENYGKRKIIN
jgi:hypothetical protein